MSKAISKQSRTDIAVFEPTPKMREYLDTAVQLLTDSPSKVAAHCEVARRTWYDWVEIPGFEDWFYSEYARLRRRIIPKLDELTMKYAKKGSFQHLELMTRKVGDLPPEPKNQTNVQVNVQPLLGGESIKNVPSNDSDKENPATE